jgi:hypothetical protein
MDLSKLTIRHGRLAGLQGPIPHGEARAWFGRPRTWDGITILTASVEIFGPHFTNRHLLADYLRGRELPPDVRLLMLDGFDGPWVRGRMERVFRTRSRDAEHLGEKSGLAGTYVAEVRAGSGPPLGVPFDCGDYYLRTGLSFSGEEDPGLCDRVAAAYWELLLAEPHDLPDYHDKMFHWGTGNWLVFGIKNGRTFIEEQA